MKNLQKIWNDKKLQFKEKALPQQMSVGNLDLSSPVSKSTSGDAQTPEDDWNKSSTEI
jgi:hypothetical protein